MVAENEGGMKHITSILLFSATHLARSALAVCISGFGSAWNRSSRMESNRIREKLAHFIFAVTLQVAHFPRWGKCRTDIKQSFPQHWKPCSYWRLVAFKRDIVLIYSPSLFPRFPYYRVSFQFELVVSYTTAVFDCTQQTRQHIKTAPYKATH